MLNLAYCDECNGGEFVVNDHGERVCANCGEHAAMHPSLWYVNAYEVTLAYGGPEEGGWWVDCGTPLACIPVRSDEDETAARALIERAFAKRFEGRPGKSSVAGDAADLRVSVERDPGKAYPTEFPHYC